MEIKTFLMLFINACNSVDNTITAATGADTISDMHKLNLVPHFGNKIEFNKKAVGMSGGSFLYEFLQKNGAVPNVTINIRLRTDLQLEQQLFVDILSANPVTLQNGKIQFVCTTGHCVFAQEGVHLDAAFDVASSFATLIDTALTSGFTEKVDYFKAVYIL